jgi:hypothetical protein
MRRPKDQVELDEETCGECKVAVCLNLFPEPDELYRQRSKLTAKPNNT